MTIPRSIRFSLLFSTLLIFLNTACVNHDLDGPVVINCSDLKPISFELDIRPIIGSNCALSGCHNGDLGDDLKWTVFQNFHDHADEVKRRITLPLSDFDKMPRRGKLTYDQIKLIGCWVEQGALEN